MIIASEIILIKRIDAKTSIDELRMECNSQGNKITSDLTFFTRTSSHNHIQSRFIRSHIWHNLFFREISQLYKFNYHRLLVNETLIADLEVSSRGLSFAMLCQRKARKMYAHASDEKFVENFAINEVRIIAKIQKILAKKNKH